MRKRQHHVRSAHFSKVLDNGAILHWMVKYAASESRWSLHIYIYIYITAWSKNKESELTRGELTQRWRKRWLGWWWQWTSRAWRDTLILRSAAKGLSNGPSTRSFATTSLPSTFFFFTFKSPMKMVLFLFPSLFFLIVLCCCVKKYYDYWRLDSVLHSVLLGFCENGGKKTEKGREISWSLQFMLRVCPWLVKLVNWE